MYAPTRTFLHTYNRHDHDDDDDDDDGVYFILFYFPYI